MKFLKIILVSLFWLFNCNTVISQNLANQWLNYTKDELIFGAAFEGDNVWVSTWGGLVNYNRAANSKVIFNTLNSEIEDNRLQDVAIDKNGNKWIIGEFNGLQKFDGINWTRFTNLSSGIPINKAYSIESDKLGNLYFMVDIDSLHKKCILKYDGLTFTENLVPFYVTGQMAIDTLNNLWLWGTNTNLVHYDGILWSTLDTTLTPLGPGYITALSFDKNNTMWVATTYGPPGASDYSVFKFDGLNWNVFNSSQVGFNTTQVYGLYSDNFNNIWIYSNQLLGLVKYNGSTFTRLTTTNFGLPSNYLNSIFFDSIGHIWTQFGLESPVSFYEYDGSTWIGHNLSNSSIQSNYLSDIIQDSTQNKWIASPGRGVSKFDGFNWVNYDTSNSGINSNYINSLYYDNFGAIWAVSNDNENSTSPLAKFDGTNWTTINYPFTGTNEAYACIMDSSGSLWVAAGSKGIGKFDGTNWTFNWVNGTSFFNDYYIDLDIDNSNKLWVINYGKGISCFDGTNWTTYTTQNSGLPDDYCGQIWIDHSNNVWTASNAGLTKFDGSSWFTYNLSNSNQTWFQLNGVTEDTLGNIWLGTKNGLTKFDGQNWFNYNKTNSLYSADFVSKVLIDKSNTKWIASNRYGLWVFNEKGLNFNDGHNTPNATISGNVFYDSNNNGLKDLPAENGIPFQKVKLLPYLTTSFTNNNGDYQFYCLPDFYKSVFVPNVNWQLTSDSAFYSIHLDTNSLSGFDFGTWQTTTQSGLSIELTAGGRRCLTPSIYWIDYKNTGSGVESGKITFVKDPNITFVNAKPFPDSISGDTLIWNFLNLNPFEIRQILVQIVNPAFYPNLSNIVYCKSFISNNQFVVDTDSSDNTISCSYDPNDKSVSPIGLTNQHLTLMNETLEYTIRFQNMGNDTAFTIVILDSLDKNLDWDSFEMLSSSHNAAVTLDTNGIVQFRFDAINLLWSTNSELLSQGFVKYRIKAKNLLAANTIVKNTARIYFDFNDAVVTNQVFNTMVYVLLGLNEKQNETTIRLSPIPANERLRVEIKDEPSTVKYIVTDIYGKLVLAQTIHSTVFSINTLNLSSGIYFLSIESMGGTIRKKFIVQH